MPGHDADRALLEEAVKTAGALALEEFGNRPKQWRKADRSPVSAADLAVDEFLKTHLLAARPDYGWLSEETPDSGERLSRRSVFILDPIDGTRAFLNGEDGWCVALAVATDRAITAAAIYAPVQDMLYAAHLGGGAARNGVPLQSSGQGDGACWQVSIPRDYLTADHWPNGVPPITPARSGAMALRLARAAAGEVDGTVSLRPVWEWDSSAGCLIAAEAGLIVTQQDGAPIRFNGAERRHRGLVVAPPKLHGLLMQHLGVAQADAPHASLT